MPTEGGMTQTALKVPASNTLLLMGSVATKLANCRAQSPRLPVRGTSGGFQPQPKPTGFQPVVFSGMDPHTVAKGRRELLAQEVEVERVRKAGGGRKPVEKKAPKSSPESQS